MSRKKQFWRIVIVFVLVIYVFFFPSATPELAIRKHMLLSFHPIIAFTAEVHNNTSTSTYGHLYTVESLSKSFIYVKSNWLGWKVTSTGTGP
ncbi:hypothetical protein SD71_20605 [Cohnella kolymensis]|uniref:Uncharacterized protein n=1 Tax=Cohnella kolymensis TaxID=1590652 RepID=A0ABR5A0F5_9BACL|nr:hypothetical protein [Cohnella kolymensis]KIL34417.1 hypothetical protein SD71_20605 [Cohnella kolymensis]